MNDRLTIPVHFAAVVLRDQARWIARRGRVQMRLRSQMLNLPLIHSYVGVTTDQEHRTVAWVNDLGRGRNSVISGA